MRVLVLSSVFPNRRQPVFGVFVSQRMLRVARHCEMVVVAPIPWFPLNRLVRGAQWSGIPREESHQGLRVYHPRVLSVPRFFKSLDALFYAASLVPFLARLRREFAFELIDAHFAYPDGVAAALLGRVFRCPVVVTLRGSIVRLATSSLHRPQLRLALGAVARVIAVSDALKRVAVDLGVAASRIRVIPNGVDTTRFTPMDRAAARRRLGLPEDRPVLLSIGSLTEGKGHHRIIGILPRLLRARPGLFYAIVGGARRGNTVRPRLERAIREHGLGASVLLAGERPYDEIPVWLAAADVFCLATRSEGWANVLLESLACGRPVVTTRVGGNPEVISDDALGILVGADDDAALLTAIGEALDRRWDAQAMVRYAAAHSWERAAAAVVEEFSTVASPPAGRAHGVAPRHPEARP